MNLSAQIATMLIMCVCFSAQADIVNDVIRLTCEDSLGYFELDYTNVNGRVAADAFKNNSLELYKKYGFVAVNNITDEFDYECKLNGNIYKMQLSVVKGVGCSGTTIPLITIKMKKTSIA